MTRIAYKDGNWIDLDGSRPEISFIPLDTKDYYYHVPRTNIILRLYSHQCGANEPLGEILTAEGHIKDYIPPFKHPHFKDYIEKYRSQIGWVTGVDKNVVSFAIYCSNPQDFRIKLDLGTLKYCEPEFGVR
ncbi:hypothetical protein [Terasakiella sp. SH-1]|uniref:hypothetical protein n=1 Tax=Terasakiella sp. SH-1 TaxID=2560057 RepID=UPI00107445EF|nr:hypothetical protein [Terasakiella sp. SH-1]